MCKTNKSKILAGWIKGIILGTCLKVRGWKWECACGHVELPLVLDLAVHLEIFWGRWVNGIILRHFYN